MAKAKAAPPSTVVAPPSTVVAPPPALAGKVTKEDWSGADKKKATIKRLVTEIGNEITTKELAAAIYQELRNSGIEHSESTVLAYINAARTELGWTRARTSSASLEPAFNLMDLARSAKALGKKLNLKPEGLLELLTTLETSGGTAGLKKGVEAWQAFESE